MPSYKREEKRYEKVVFLRLEELEAQIRLPSLPTGLDFTSVRNYPLCPSKHEPIHIVDQKKKKNLNTT